MTRASLAKYLDSVQKRIQSGQLTTEAAEDEVNDTVMRNAEDAALYQKLYKQAEDAGVSTTSDAFGDMLKEITANLRSPLGGKRGRRKTRRGGTHTRIKEENGLWYIYVNGQKSPGGLKSFEEAKKAVEKGKDIRAAMTLSGMKAGAHSIKKEGDKWYIHVGSTKSKAYDSFEKAKEALATAKASLTLAEMKMKGGAFTIKEENGRWYVYQDSMKIRGYSSFEKAKKGLEIAKEQEPAVETLVKMKNAGRRVTRRRGD
jgi:hypothetical protein